MGFWGRADWSSPHQHHRDFSVHHCIITDIVITGFRAYVLGLMEIGFLGDGVLSGLHTLLRGLLLTFRRLFVVFLGALFFFFSSAEQRAARTKSVRRV